MMKHQLRHADGGDFEAARASAADWTRKTLDAPDFKEALAAQREGRAPRFEPVTAVFAPPISKTCCLFEPQQMGGCHSQHPGVTPAARGRRQGRERGGHAG